MTLVISSHTFTAYNQGYIFTQVSIPLLCKYYYSVDTFDVDVHMMYVLLVCRSFYSVDTFNVEPIGVEPISVDTCFVEPMASFGLNLFNKVFKFDSILKSEKIEFRTISGNFK